MQSSLKFWRVAAAAAIVLLAVLAALRWRESPATARLQSSNAQLSRQPADARYEAKPSTTSATDYRQAAQELDSKLGEAKLRQTATDLKAEELIRRLSTGDEQLNKREQRIDGLLKEIEHLKEVAAQPSTGDTTSSPPDRAVVERIKQLEDQVLDLLSRALQEPSTPVAAASAGWRVLRVGSAGTFVITDFGVNSGATVDRRLVVARGTKVLARVQISNVREDFSIAQVLPGTAKAQLQPGDFVLLED
jgi:hypothetical protein